MLSSAHPIFLLSYAVVVLLRRRPGSRADKKSRSSTTTTCLSSQLACLTAPGHKGKMPASVAVYPAKIACCLQLHHLRRPSPAPLPARVLFLLSTPRLRPVRASPGPSPPNSFAGWSSDSDSGDDGADKSTLGFGRAGGETHSIRHLLLLLTFPSSS